VPITQVRQGQQFPKFSEARVFLKVRGLSLSPLLKQGGLERTPQKWRVPWLSKIRLPYIIETMGEKFLEEVTAPRDTRE
jgi:hypothetical protein